MKKLVVLILSALALMEFHIYRCADFSFIPGALVPGLLLLQPDYIENKDDWPFFWGQNEATIGGNASYLLFGAMLSSLAD